jgi:hypothetical protein
MDEETYDQFQAQDALQQKQLDAQMSPYAPQMMEQMQQAQAVLVSQTNPRQIVREIILRIKGLEEKPDGRVLRVSPAKLNKKGIDDISFILDSHINDNVRLSHVDDPQIAKIMNAVQEDLVDKLALNWKIYDVEDKTDLDAINDCVLINIFLVLNRAREQNEKNWLGKISVENIGGGGRFPSMKKESFWSKFRL